MTEPVGPIDRLSRARRVSRRTSAAEPGQDGMGEPAPNLPVKVASTADEPAPPRRPGAAAYAAQVMGQGEQRRGLRGGPETLDRARTTYLETEWSGGADRRLARGRITKTEI